MFHLAAFTANQAIGALLADCPGVNDGLLTIGTNAHYFYNGDLQAILAFAAGPFITEARLNYPSARNLGLPVIGPLNVVAGPQVLDVPPFVNFGDYPPLIPQRDEITFQTSNNSAGLDRHIAGLWLQTGRQDPVPPGPATTLRFTGTIAANSLAWTPGTFALEQSLPRGRYAVIGMDLIGANLIFGRLRGQFQTFLPGCLARATQATRPALTRDFRFGALGKWLEFESVSPPTIEIFSNGANAAQEGYLDVIKIN